MSELIPRPSADVAQPWNGGRVVGAVVDACRANGSQIPPSWKKIIGAHAKALLDDGFSPETVVAAATMSVLRGRPEVMQYVAGDLELAKGGIAMTEAEYRQKLALYEADHRSGGHLLGEQRARRLAAEQARDERRNGCET